MKNNIARRSTRSFATAFAVAVSAAAFLADAARAADSAVVVMYHRFGEPDHRSTNIQIDQFEAHIRELTSGPYSVLPLGEVAAAMARGKRLPDRAVAITVDDAYLSVYTDAWPRLKAAGLPFTVFVATRAVNSKLPGFMTWDQIREMQQAGVTIAAHTHSHLHMADADTARNRREIEVSNRILRRELGAVPTIFAYPYGEASAAVADLVRNGGYEVAFGQHSGVAFRGLGRYYLPRFALNETYGYLERFRLVVNALPLPATGFTPADPLLTPPNNPPAFGFTVAPDLRGLSGLACYHSQAGQGTIERLGNTRMEIRFSKAFSPGRSRVNCTMPAGNGRWRWLGMQFYVPR